MRLRRLLPALVLGLALPAASSAQDAAGRIVIFQTQLRGEINDDAAAPLRDALHAGLAADGRLEVLTEDETATILGPSAICADSECAVAAGAASGALLGVAVDLYAEAEIYDFTVRVYRLADGEVLAEQPGECTFCPLAEAIESLRFTAESTLDSIDTMPSAPVVAVADAGGSNPADGGSETTDPQGPTDGGDATSPTEPTPRQPRAPRAESRFTQRAVGGIAIGVGSAALIGGVVALAFDGQTNCSEGPVSACPELYETTAGGITLAALGGIAIGTGIGLIVTGRDRDEPGVDVAIVPSRGGGLVRLNARF